MIAKPSAHAETPSVLGLFPADDFVVTTGNEAARIDRVGVGLSGEPGAPVAAAAIQSAPGNVDSATDLNAAGERPAGQPARPAEATAGAGLGNAWWLFRDEVIAVPRERGRVAGYAARLRALDDVQTWGAQTRPGSVRDYPCLVWLGAADVLAGARLDEKSEHWLTAQGTWRAALVDRLATNRAYCNEASLDFFRQHRGRLRGVMAHRQFTVRSYWPEDYRLDVAAGPSMTPRAVTPQAIRAALRQTPLPRAGEGPGRYTVRALWRRTPERVARAVGQPVIGLMLNGAQGDDDEAHAGHFALLSGRLGDEGAMHDWLVANFYALDSVSEKGIVAGMRPLDGYLGDLNNGQAWYRPSWMLVAVLREERAASHLTSALARLFNQCYRNPASYHHTAANCSGLSLSVLRALGWQVPTLGPTSWLGACAALPLETWRTRSLRQGKLLFDYLSEERTRLFPALAFEQAAADLLCLVQGSSTRCLTPYEECLRDDVDEILLVHVPQFPSGRAWGSFPVAGIGEYRRRLPADLAQRQIIPLAPRVFPQSLRDAQAPRTAPTRSDYAVALAGTLLLAAVAEGLRRTLRGRR